MSGKVKVEIENVSAKQALLNRWMATDKRSLQGKSSLQSNAFRFAQELLVTGTYGAKSFQSHWKEVVGPAERAVFVCLPNSCRLGHTGPGDGTRLEVGNRHYPTCQPL